MATSLSSFTTVLDKTFRASPWISALACTIICFILKYAYRVTFHPLARFPGPTWAALTSIYAMSFDLPKKTSYIKQFPAWHDKYGSIIRIMPNHLHIRDISAYNQVYKVASEYNKDITHYNFPFGNGSLMSTLNVRESRPHRDLYSSYFTRGSMLKFEPAIQRNVAKFLQRVDEMSARDEAIDLNLGWSAVTADNITEHLYGKSWGALDISGFKHNDVEPMENFTGGPVFKMALYFPGTVKWASALLAKIPDTARKWNGAVDIMLGQIEKCHRSLQTLKASGTIAGPYSTALSPIFEKGHPTLTDQVMSVDGWVFVAAGTDVLAVTLRMAIWHLLDNPRYLRNLEQELSVIPHSTDLAAMPLGWADLEKLGFLTCVIKEALRMSYGVCGLNPRVIPPGGASLAGQFIPGGTAISMSCYVYHHAEEYFSTHPHQEFRPERWMGTSAEKSGVANVPFGRGSRDCIGRELSWVTLYTSLAYFIRRYSLTLYDTTKEDMEWQDALIALTFEHLKVKAVRKTE